MGIMGVVSRMVTRYLAVAFLFVATATAQDDFWPPFQEEWRCLGEDDGGYYDWVDDTPAWVEETHHLITYVDNPEGQAALDFDFQLLIRLTRQHGVRKELTTILYLVTAMPTTVVLHKTMEKYDLASTSANLTIWCTIQTPNLASITIKHLLELALPLVLDQQKVHLHLNLPLNLPLNLLLNLLLNLHLNPHLNLHLNLHLNPHLNLHLNQPHQPLHQPLHQRLQLPDLQPIANTKVKNCLIPEIAINTTGASLIPIIPFTSKFSLVVIGLLTLIKALVYGQTSTTTSALKLLDRIPKYF